MSDDGSNVAVSAEEIARENEELRAQLAAANAAREVEARRADGLYTRVASGDRQLASAQVSSLAAQEQQAESAIVSIGAEITGLKQQQANLFAEGKFEEAADVSEKLGDATARRNQAQQAKTYFAQQREAASKQPVDPVDRFLAQNQNFTEKEREWIKANPRFATDNEFQARVTKAHAEIVAKGIAPQSPEYFQGLEQAGYMRAAPQSQSQPSARADGGASGGADDDGPYSGAATDPLEDPVQTPPARPPARSQVAAAPSHRAPATPGARPAPGRVNLTPEQAELALAAAEYFPDEIRDAGNAEIFAYWAKLNNSDLAKAKRAGWAGI